MAIPASYRIYADLVKNRLYVILKGRIVDKDITAAADLCIEEVRKLKPGFGLITDISEFVAATAFGASEIKRAQAFIASNQVGRIIRVVDQSKNLIARLQFERTGEEAGYKPGADVAGSMEEAEAKMNEKK